MEGNETHPCDWVIAHGRDPVGEAASAGAADSAPFDVERRRGAPSRKSCFAVTSLGHASPPRVRGAMAGTTRSTTFKPLWLRLGAN